MQEDLFIIMQKSSQKLQQMFIFSTRSHRGFGTQIFEIVTFIILDLLKNGPKFVLTNEVQESILKKSD